MAFMIEKIRNTAAEIQSSTFGYGDLSMAVYHNNMVIESMDKLILNQSKVSKSLHMWSQKQTNILLRSLMKSYDDINSMWVCMLQKYIKQFELQKTVLNSIISSHKMLDEKKKDINSIETKVTKLKKQLDSAGKNDDLIKTEMLHNELGKVINLKEDKQEELKTFEAIHEMQKFHQLMNGAEKQLIEAKKLLEDGSVITSAQTNICMTCKTLGHDAEIDNVATFDEYCCVVISELQKSLLADSELKYKKNYTTTNQENLIDIEVPVSNLHTNIQKMEEKADDAIEAEEEELQIDAMKNQFDRLRGISIDEPLREYNILAEDPNDPDVFTNKDDLILQLELSESIDECRQSNGDKTHTDDESKKKVRHQSILSVSSIQDEYIDD